MAITITEAPSALPFGAVPSAPVFEKSVRLALAATDVYAPGGLRIAAALEAAFPGLQVRGEGIVMGLDGTEVRIFEVKTEPSAGVAYSGDDGTGGTQTFNLTDGDTLTIAVDGGAPQVATFNTGDFVDIDAATAAEVATVINTDIAGVSAAADANGRVVITSDTTGATSIVNIVGATGTAVTQLHFTVGAGGSHTGTAEGTPRLLVLEETGGVLAEVAANTDLSGHTAVDLQVSAV